MFVKYIIRKSWHSHRKSVNFGIFRNFGGRGHMFLHYTNFVMYVAFLFICMFEAVFGIRKCKISWFMTKFETDNKWKCFRYFQLYFGSWCSSNTFMYHFLYQFLGSNHIISLKYSLEYHIYLKYHICGKVL